MALLAVGLAVAGLGGLGVAACNKVDGYERRITRNCDNWVREGRGIGRDIANSVNNLTAAIQFASNIITTLGHNFLKLCIIYCILLVVGHLQKVYYSMDVFNLLLDHTLALSFAVLYFIYTKCEKVHHQDISVHSRSPHKKMW